MNDDTRSSSGNWLFGTSFCNLLFLTFLVLKLTKVIDWSWWWITAPLWAPIALIALVVGLLLFIAIVSGGLTKREDRWLDN